MSKNNENRNRIKRYRRGDFSDVKKRRKVETVDNTPKFRIFIGGHTPGLFPKNPEEKSEDIDKNINMDDYFNTEKELLEIDKEINTLKDLIELGKTYIPKDEKRYVINLKLLNRCTPFLEELNSMIGMQSIKETIVDLIFYYLQNFYKDDKSENMLHTIIEGTPGCGKTEVAKILGKIYYGLGLIPKSKFTSVKRSDLIGKYLGHTAKMTQDVFNKAEGGILFIDEAYALGNPEGKDSFAKECIDTINQNLTEKKGKIIVIIAGYKEQLMSSFFSYNPGLARRFPFRFTINNYTGVELRLIYMKMVNENNWSLLNKKSLKVKFFEDNLEYFKYSGGDMEILFHLTKITHARRVFGKGIKIRKKISYADLEKAFELFLNNDEVKKRKDTTSHNILSRMYI